MSNRFVFLLVAVATVFTAVAHGSTVSTCPAGVAQSWASQICATGEMYPCPFYPENPMVPQIQPSSGDSYDQTCMNEATALANQQCGSTHVYTAGTCEFFNYEFWSFYGCWYYITCPASAPSARK